MPTAAPNRSGDCAAASNASSLPRDIPTMPTRPGTPCERNSSAPSTATSSGISLSADGKPGHPEVGDRDNRVTERRQDRIPRIRRHPAPRAPDDNQPSRRGPLDGQTGERPAPVTSAGHCHDISSEPQPAPRLSGRTARAGYGHLSGHDIAGASACGYWDPRRRPPRPHTGRVANPVPRHWIASDHPQTAASVGYCSAVASHTRGLPSGARP